MRVRYLLLELSLWMLARLRQCHLWRHSSPCEMSWRVGARRASEKERYVSDMLSGFQIFLVRNVCSDSFVTVSIRCAATLYIRLQYCHVVLGSAVRGRCLSDCTASWRVMSANQTQSWRGKPVRWDRMSVIVVWAVVQGSCRTKSAGRRVCTAVSHWIAG